jgi:LacI family transcriptional regulator
VPTIRQIAKACRVSPMTVSFVLNNKQGQVSDETRERVLKAMRDMGYRPRAILPQEPEITIRTLGVAVGREYNTFAGGGYFSEILNGILAATDKRGLNVLLFHNTLFHQDTHQSLRTYFDGRCDGLFVVAPIMGMPLIDALVERGVPHVLIGDSGDHENVSSVDVDNIAEAERVVSYLVSLGHRRIVFCGGPSFVRSACLRREGYRCALQMHGIPYDPELDLAPLSSESLVYERIQTLMNRRDILPPTAIFGWNDTAAFRALWAVRDLKIAVPERVSVIGFDDSPSAMTSEPPLTSVRQPYREIGIQAVETLVARIRDNHVPGQRLYLPARLVPRDSVGPPRVVAPVVGTNRPPPSFAVGRRGIMEPDAGG